MSFVVKGIDLPKDGEWYNIVIASNGEGFVDVVSEDNALTKTEPIQAIQIPKGHGRLIDADELMSKFRETMNDDYNKTHTPASWSLGLKYGVITIIDDAPTILEAEEE